MQDRRRVGPGWPLAILVASLGVGCEVPPRYAGGVSDQAAPRGGKGAACETTAEGAVCARSRPVLTCDVTNARDLGGVPLEPRGNVACGVLLRGPPLANLPADGCADVTRLGLATVIDLRSDAERVAAPDDACLGGRAVAAPMPIPYDVSPADYLADFDTDDSIAKVFDTLADAAAYPVYFHCTYGRDRTGVVAAAVLLALGASRDDVMREYELSVASVGAFPDSLAALLDEIDARGGIDVALAAKGVSAADLTALRRSAAVP